jgi:RimJ/RimL family protein N-acetyltransferase
MEIVFETDRLIVREYEPSDAPALFEVFREPDIWRWLGGGSVWTELAQAESAIERQIERREAEPERRNWAVVVRDTGRLIGVVLIAPLEEGPEVEIGYMIGKPWWGNGYATEVCTAGITWAFRNLPVEHLVGVVFPANVASQNVLVKSGMTFRRMRHTFGADMRYYTITRIEHERDHSAIAD